MQAWGNHALRATRRFILVGIAAAALLVPLTARADLGGAERFIQDLGDRTLAVLEQPVGPGEKLGQLKNLLDRSTDLELVARLVLGRYWRQATPEQQAEYVRLFKDLVMQTMAERFSWYTGETFEIAGAKPVDERDTMVSTRILRPSGKAPILVDWRVRESSGSFLLIDILAEGVSLVVTQRAEAAEVIGRDGLDGLLGQMRDRLARRATAG
jgi:phospholipid transport system substrate-binding protein